MKALVLFLLAMLPLAAAPLLDQPAEARLPVRTSRDYRFTLAQAPAPGRAVLLEFDARIDFRTGFGGYHAKAMLAYVNEQLVPVEACLNIPMEFHFINGHTGEPGRWSPAKVNFEQVKTGNRYEDNVLKRGGNYLALTYAPNFEDIDTPKNKYSSTECSRCHFVMDITSLCKKGENTVTIYSAVSPADVKIMGGSLTNPNNKRGSLDVVVRRLVVHDTTEVPVRKAPFWLAELAEISRGMPFVEPRSDFAENYRLRMGLGGAVILAIGKEEYRLNTHLSYPGKGAFNRIPGNAKDMEPTWKLQVNPKALTLEGKGDFYKISREIDRKPGCVEVRDTLENLTDKPVPIMVRYEVPFKLHGRERFIMNSGLKVTAPIIDYTYFPENPTFFLNSPDGSLGLIPGDDILRIHAKNYVVPGAVQLRDEQLLLAPRKKITLKLQLYPVEHGDYFTFINQVRKTWDLNGEEADGTIRSAIAMPSPTWKLRKGNTAIHVNCRNDKNQWLWGLALAQNKQVHQNCREIIAAFRKILPKGVKIYANYMALYFSNATGEDLERFKECVLVNKNGTYPMEAGCRFYIPTRTNDFGKMIVKTIDMMLDDWKADGIYFDYLEGADPYFTYNQKDGVSCDIDPKTGTLLCEKGSYQLLAQDFTVWLMKYVHGKGALIEANRNPFTWTTATTLKKETPFRFTECGYPDQLARGHLGFVPLGLQRTLNNDLHLQVIRALYEGMLTIPYNVSYGWDDNPVAYTFPFRFRELRRGCAIGDNKIVTAVSGYFGWGDDSGFTVRVFDSVGHLKPDAPAQTVVKNGRHYVKVILAPREVAVIERRK